MKNTAKPQLRAAWKKEKTQAGLREQYGIERPDVIVVERKNILITMLRVMLKALAMALRVIAAVAVIVLASVGAAALIYPNIRAEVMNTALQIICEMQSYF